MRAAGRVCVCAWEWGGVGARGSCKCLCVCNVEASLLHPMPLNEVGCSRCV